VHCNSVVQKANKINIGNRQTYYNIKANDCIVAQSGSMFSLSISLQQLNLLSCLLLTAEHTTSICWHLSYLQIYFYFISLIYYSIIYYLIFSFLIWVTDARLSLTAICYGQQCENWRKLDTCHYPYMANCSHWKGPWLKLPQCTFQSMPCLNPF